MLATGAAVAVLAAGFAAVPQAAAAPYGAQYVRSIRCDSPNPWPGPRLPIIVDVYTGGPFPTDGLPGPAISLSANNPGGVGQVLELTSLITVDWRNLDTGRTGSVRVPTRSHAANWDVVLHPGHGRVAFTVHQKIGAMAFNPMVNPQFSSCRGTAVA
ncbi:hypothetical protein [Gordonia neofelifaecis]|uniref:Secreted protein n=1 Tax=Gordonia neofelifaecis NRRL B-59395 TaxID=644548 RepID=F1YEM5_9ACTN|nr:hypothetical protein [Gordonia neofelifaecis]EGD56858.1 hypothetical protein SCNU_00730 [Gordonia neofelifaecis NRRL B-59395]